jgi:hypothetical protein
MQSQNVTWEIFLARMSDPADSLSLYFPAIQKQSEIYTQGMCLAAATIDLYSSYETANEESPT